MLKVNLTINDREFPTTPIGTKTGKKNRLKVSPEKDKYHSSDICEN